jgi:hypothetical protein
MDEYSSGMDPEIKNYFKKIVNSFTWFAIWLISVASAGLFFGLGEVNGAVKWFNILFYFLALVTFIWLIRYLYRLWK